MYLTAYAETHSDIALLSINTFQKDCKDDNPMVRGLALRTMANLRVPQIVEYLVEPLQKGLVDPAAYVRKTAVLGCLKLFHMVPGMVRDSGMVDKLYEMLDDRDAQVVSNAIVALNDILHEEGGMVVNSKIAIHLMSRLREFNEWSQSVVLELLSRYTPESEDEIFDIMNILDDRLFSSNTALVLGVARLMLRLTQNMADVHLSVHERLRTPLLTLSRCSRPEVAFPVLSHIVTMVERHPGVFGADFKHFYCRAQDPGYLRELKLRILTAITNEMNMHDVISELAEYVVQPSDGLPKQALGALSKVCTKLPASVTHVIGVIRALMESETETILSGTVILMRDLLHKYPAHAQELIPLLKNCYQSLDAVPDAKAALIWILGQHGKLLPEAPYMLESYIEDYSDEEVTPPVVQAALLTAVTTLFFQRPPECQGMLGRLLEEAIADVAHADVHDRALLYYRLLHTDVRQAQNVIAARKNMISVFAEEERAEVQDRIFEEFNSLAVVYGKPSELFVPKRTLRPLIALALEDDDLDGGDEEAADQGVAVVSGGFTAVPGAVLSPEDFQARWTNLGVSAGMEATLSPVPELSRLEASFTSGAISTMASGTVEQEMKLYVYGCSAADQGWHLAEVIVNTESGAFNATVKSDIPETGPGFANLLNECLVRI